ncbi:MAG: class I tRNA ligase family protein, partial [Patescibacteria group bacterium]
ETINWVPEHLKKGRFGEFLKDVRDWAFSRERYWGTPLPIWKCDACNGIEVIGSIEELGKKSSPQKNTYLFMRHGEALSNARGIASSKGVGHILTPKGRKQVEVAAKKLKQQEIDMIVCSPILRAYETGEMVGRALGVLVHIDARLAEVNVGAFDGRKINEYYAFFSSMKEIFTKRPPEGENLHDVRSRMLNFIEEMEQKYDGKKILVISHESPIWMAYAGGRGFTDGQSMELRIGKRKNDFVGLAEVMEVSYVGVPRDETGEINLHRPFVDEFMFLCAVCGKGIMKRVPEVADVWFDSGAMPFAQAHYPFNILGRSEGAKRLKDIGDSSPSIQHDTDGGLAFPADYISEAVDQTRGWFYTLLAIATLLGKQAPYKNVISLGHVLDKNGQKMSKSKGNVVNPFDMIQKYGVDTLRWYFYCINSPGEPKRFDEKDLLLKQRSFLGTWWNSFVFFDTYVKKIRCGEKSKNVLDRWIIEKTDRLINDVTGKLDAYDITGASRAIEQFVVSDFSQWYLRRSRERFQRPRTIQEKKDAAETTAHVLDTLCRLTAPFTPFLSEYIYQEIRKKTGQKEISVHLLGWPEVSSRTEKEPQIIGDMETVRTLVASALKLRADAGIKVRQPLQTLHIPDTTLPSELRALIQDEVNVKEVVNGKELLFDTIITPELKEEGIAREFTRNIQEMRRDLGFMPTQKARVIISGDTECETMITRWQKKIKQDTNLSELRVSGKKEFRIEREIDIDGKQLWIGMR